MNNFISIVHEFNLVIYTDEQSVSCIDTRENPRIKVVIKPIEQFYNYKYKESWINNHEKNHLLKDKSCWELNMLWSEKVWFVKETQERNYFDTPFYGWCDIGYFRNRDNDIHTSQLATWGKNMQVFETNADKICYGCVQNDDRYMNYLFKCVNHKNEHGLPMREIPAHQTSIAGGFFVVHRDNVGTWASLYDSKLALYFRHHYLVKDDQIILVDCILSELDRFLLFRENRPGVDNWFMFHFHL